MAGRKRTDAQREISFTKRGEDLNNIRRARLGDPLAKLMLWTLDNRIGAGHAWELTFSQLAEEMEVDRATAYRKAEALRAAGLIDFELVDEKLCRYRFRIVRSNVADFIPTTSEEPRPRRGRPRKIVAHSENISHTAKTFRTQRKSCRTQRNALLNNAHITPTNARDEWEAVEARTLAYGIGDAAGAITEAREKGAPAYLVDGILAHAESHPGAWPPGIVWRRIRNARAGQNPADLWPEPSAEFLSLQKNAQAAAQRDATAARDAEARANAEAAMAALEAAYASELDCMAEADRIELVGRFGNRALYRQSKSPEFRRSVLLAALAKRDGRALTQGASR